MRDIKFIGIAALVFILSIAYQVFASYLTSPSGLKYPNPGHYPEQIGPGSFNCSGNANCYWEFPNAMYISSSSGKVGIGTTNPEYELDISGSARVSEKIIANKICLKRSSNDSQFVCIDNWEELLDILFAQAQER